MKRIFTLIITLICLTQPSLSELFEIEIPTRVEEADKKFLNADLHSEDTTKAKPVILIQTPYSKNIIRPWFNNPDFFKNLQLPIDYNFYHYVVMDWRGFFTNKDKNITNYDRGLDGYDAVEWIAEQKWCNGKAATWGASALGLIQFQTARHQPPHLVCINPLVKGYRNTHYQYYYGGVLREEHLSDLITLGFGAGQVINYPDYGAFWQLIEEKTDYAPDIKVPALMISGWYDLAPKDVIKDFYNLVKKGDESVRDQHKCIMGPWLHSGVGQTEQGVLSFPDAKNAAREAAKFFFDYYLLGAKNGYPLRPQFSYFQMGENKWRETKDWLNISADEKVLYLHPEGKLKFEPVPPVNMIIPPDTINYEPRDPSPTIGGCRLSQLHDSVGPRNMSYVESRHDVVTYQTEKLEEELILSGRMKVILNIASNRTDTDFSVRLCEVYPDGRTILIRQGIRRARYRNALSEQNLLEPGEIYELTVEFDDLAKTFPKGHQLKIILSCSNYPMFAENPNSGGTQYQAGDTLTAENLIYHDEVLQSRIIIPTTQTTSVERYAGAETGNVKIYPNPAEDRMTIEFMNKIQGERNVEIYDLLGNKLKNYRIISRNQNKCLLDVSGLRSNIYLLKISDNENNWVRMLNIIK